MGNIGDSFFQFQIALLVTMAFLAEQSKLDINLRSQVFSDEGRWKKYQSECLCRRKDVPGILYEISSILFSIKIIFVIRKNTTISKIQHKIQGNIFLPPYFRFFFLKERLPIRDVGKNYKRRAQWKKNQVFHPFFAKNYTLSSRCQTDKKFQQDTKCSTNEFDILGMPSHSWVCITPHPSIQ